MAHTYPSILVVGHYDHTEPEHRAMRLLLKKQTERLNAKLLEVRHSDLIASESSWQSSCLILDVPLLSVSEAELFDAIRIRLQDSFQYILAITNKSDWTHRLIAAGCDDVLLKPLNQKRLSTSLNRLVLALEHAVLH